ncbi:MAG: diguanylate cyclase response regulator [Hyphomicrobiales bacterium]|nr:diguanylate cyclase response regulator [Hyphomicrobiales bacterium]
MSEEMPQELKVLVVEDSPERAASLIEALEAGAIDARSTRVDNRDDLRAALFAETWDVVLSNDNLVNIDASQVLLVVVASGQQIPFIIVSETMAMTRAVTLMKMGANDFVLYEDLENLPAAVRREMRSMEISRQKEEAESSNWRLANFDPLTDLPNRRLFFDRLSHALRRAKRQESGVALLYLDLDHFKWINDNLGHAAGDKLLKEASQRLKDSIRESDTVARIGGDEFAIVLTDVDQEVAAEAVARKILVKMQDPMFLKDNEVYVGVSIGIAMYPQHGDESKTLVHNADLAMYQSKRRGRNDFRVYSPDIHDGSHAEENATRATPQDPIILRGRHVEPTREAPSADEAPLRIPPAQRIAAAAQRQAWPLAAKIAFIAGLIMISISIGTNLSGILNPKQGQMVAEEAPSGEDLNKFATAAGGPRKDAGDDAPAAAGTDQPPR